MASFDCDFHKHEACPGEQRIGNLATDEVNVYQCACECHGPDRDGRWLRRVHLTNDGDKPWEELSDG